MTEQQTPALNQIGESMTDNSFIARIFTEARTHKAFLDRPVEESTLRQLYETAKFAPSASNLCPMRISFVTSAEAKQTVIAAAADGNKPKVQTAPVIAVVAHDMEFYKHLGTLAPHLDADSFAAQGEDKLRMQASNNTWLQGGYLILAARALGLDCGPMSGFDNDKVDAEFFGDGRFRTNFLMNIGYGEPDGHYPRAPRFEFDEVCEIL